MKIFNNILNTITQSISSIQRNFQINPYRITVKQIRNYRFELMADAQIKEHSALLIAQARNRTPLTKILPEAYALAIEAIKRKLQVSLYDEQLFAAIALYHGKLIEMKTGEGKTFAAVLPAYLQALEGKGIHVLTFNDYLAERDAEWLRSVFELLGLNVSYVKDGMTFQERQAAYAADVTYLTAKESGFDLLRDARCSELTALVHRPFHAAIVDEADSILIDEARIPLILAGEMEQAEDHFVQMAQIADQLKQGADYGTDEYKRNIHLTDSGAAKVEHILACGNLYDLDNASLLTAISCALHAKVLFRKNVDYIIREGKVELIDEFTGRVADQRRWPDGLQAAVEAKEGLQLQPAGRVLGSISLQHLVRMYPKLSGMTATAQTSKEEFNEMYELEVVSIPLHQPSIRVDHPIQLYTDQDLKIKAIVKEVQEVHATGRPILIGTSSVAESARLAERFTKANIKCVVLNAKNDREEAEIIADAGAIDAITVSTNMAGRGVDIRLGGRNQTNAERVKQLGGLYVIGTNLHESKRVDQQLKGRAGRQGDPGSSKFFISLKDDLLVKFGIKELLPPQYKTLRQDEPLLDAELQNQVSNIQSIIEGQNYDIRRTLNDYSDIVEGHRKAIFHWRDEVLHHPERLTFLSSNTSEAVQERYEHFCARYGQHLMYTVEQQLTLYMIDQSWADYLDYTAYIRESIHLERLARENPLDIFMRRVTEVFVDMPDTIEQQVLEAFLIVEISEDGADLAGQGLIRPTSTWTYIVNDNFTQNKISLFQR